MIILGAGIAGVGAAQTLAEQGITNFVILEGRDVVGGPLSTRQFGDIKINTGAGWVHLTKENSENPL